MQQRHAEGEGLAHAGAGLSDEVVAGQRQRQGQFLDGEGVFDAVLGQCAHDLVADAEFGEDVWVLSMQTCVGRRLVFRLSFLVDHRCVHARTSLTRETCGALALEEAGRLRARTFLRSGPVV